MGRRGGEHPCKVAAVRSPRLEEALALERFGVSVSQRGKRFAQQVVPLL